MIKAARAGVPAAGLRLRTPDPRSTVSGHLDLSRLRRFHPTATCSALGPPGARVFAASSHARNISTPRARTASPGYLRDADCQRMWIEPGFRYPSVLKRLSLVNSSAHWRRGPRNTRTRERRRVDQVPWNVPIERPPEARISPARRCLIAIRKVQANSTTGWSSISARVLETEADGLSIDLYGDILRQIGRLRPGTSSVHRTEGNPLGSLALAGTPSPRQFSHAPGLNCSHQR